MPIIVLARHGRPVWDRRTPIAWRELRAWNAGNDAAPIDPASRPSEELVEHARACSLLVASTLRRSHDSAAIAAPGKDIHVDELYREVFLPTPAPRSAPASHAIRLPPPIWTTVARIGWICGWSPGVESHAGARARARVAAASLIELAREREYIVLIGHGTMNGMISKRLLRLGWRGPWFRPRKYWAFGVYRRSES